MTGLMVVVNEVKMMDLVVVVKVVKMMGLVVVVNVVNVTGLLAVLYVVKIGFCGSSRVKAEKGEKEEKNICLYLPPNSFNENRPSSPTRYV